MTILPSRSSSSATALTTGPSPSTRKPARRRKIRKPSYDIFYMVFTSLLWISGGGYRRMKLSTGSFGLGWVIFQCICWRSCWVWRWWYYCSSNTHTLFSIVDLQSQGVILVLGVPCWACSMYLWLNLNINPNTWGNHFVDKEITPGSLDRGTIKRTQISSQKMR